MKPPLIHFCFLCGARSVTSIALISLLLFAAACNSRSHTTKRGLYYWKSNESDFQPAEVQYLHEVHADKLYVKFFEIDRDLASGLVPVSKTSLQFWGNNPADSLLKGIEVVPVIYIKNEALLKSSAADMEALAVNIAFLTDKYFRRFSITKVPLQELQLDCDWTLGTKERYFQLLTALKKASGKRISCTLRLYPYKYNEKMGIPPVDRATLMCYNLINPLTQENKNSILDARELKSYLTRRRRYPLPLDIALPAYSWMQVYQYNRFVGVLYKNNTDLLGILKPVKPHWYEVLQDTVIDRLYLRRGDQVKYEQGGEQLAEAIELLKNSVHLDDQATLTFFHLDEQVIKDFPHEKLDSFYRFAAARN